MGSRVRTVLILLSLLAVLALAVPLGQSSADRRTARLAEERNRQLNALAADAADPDVPLQPVLDRYWQVYGEGVLVVDADGRTLAASRLSIADPAVRAVARAALVDEPGSPWDRVLPWDRTPVLASTGVRNSREIIGAVVLAVDRRAVAHDVGRAWAAIALGCLALLGCALLVARALTTWVLRPVDGLERAVAEMTRGEAGRPVALAGPPELRHVTSAFNTMAEVVRASLERQRRLVADASHQLRNPLAALRLRADNLEPYVEPPGRRTYDAMSAELDRLEGLLDKLLLLARAEEASGTRQAGLVTDGENGVLLDDVVEERVAFWRPVLELAGQRVVVRTGPGVCVRLPEHDIAQLLDVALDNAARYAGEGATVTVCATARGDVAELSVADDGPGLPADQLTLAGDRFWRGRTDVAGSGLGLAIAREIVIGHGGGFRLERAREGGLRIRLTLPAGGEGG